MASFKSKFKAKQYISQFASNIKLEKLEVEKEHYSYEYPEDEEIE